jgi:hypothetical protein
MYVAPDGRRRGIARRILQTLEQLAAGFNYRAIRLETGLEQPEAIGLYESSGYHRIAPYGHHKGDPRSVCFEKAIYDKTRKAYPVERLCDKSGRKSTAERRSGDEEEKRHFFCERSKITEERAKGILTH